jgi:iron complex transport system ATP-binding protein
MNLNGGNTVPRSVAGARVHLSGVTATINRTPIIGAVDLVAEPGQIVGLIGPNGSGKSTLLRTIYRSLRPESGVIHLDGDDLWRMPTREAARRRAAVTQDHSVDAGFTVRDVVAMGRTPHKGFLDRHSGADQDIIDDALDRVRMSWAGERIFASLSGGERQRVLLARALAQQTSLLVLDEPTNHLDVRAQLDLLELVHSLQLTTVTALHDLDHAAAYCDHLVLLRGGGVVAAGPPVDVLTPDRIAEVFGVQAHLGPHPITGRLHVTTAPLSRETIATGARQSE